MKMPSPFLLGSAVAAMLISVCICLTGCEEAKGLNGLTLDPASATLTPDAETVTITVSGVESNSLALPIVWRVADASMGTITHSGGFTAIYERSDANGVNTVVARDQYDNEGFATIRQAASSYAITLTATPSTTIEIGTASTIVIDSTDAIAPFSWSLVSGPGSLTGGSGSRSAVYSSSVIGTGVIRVTDGNGVQGTIAIVVQDSSAGAGGGAGGAGGS